MIGFARELVTIKNILDIKEAIIVIDIKSSKDSERNINALGVRMLHKDNFGGFFNGK